MWCCPAPPLLARLLPALLQGACLCTMPSVVVVASRDEAMLCTTSEATGGRHKPPVSL